MSDIFIRHFLSDIFFNHKRKCISLIEYGTPLCSITIWQRKGNGKFLESSIICFSLGNQICHLHCEGTGLITYNEDIAAIYVDNEYVDIEFDGEFDRELTREKFSGITTVFHSKYLPSFVRMFYWLEFNNINGAVTGISISTFELRVIHDRLGSISPEKKIAKVVINRGYSVCSEVTWLLLLY